MPRFRSRQSYSGPVALLRGMSPAGGRLLSGWKAVRLAWVEASLIDDRVATPALINYRREKTSGLKT
ncbi:hypothetical protein IBL26_01355 [Roseomonas aerophila]|uniref:Uncharacterized protein n=1 Tax=Teichococcus aerophilus TaxID=1224513 RepID=A0ABR7RGE8_9PROT|nr:hypothetical protein [Pseudoroseomonas aerophila]MBC9205466.1 hypothetical protein [Pseudoroseomonas aerophila]